MHKSSLLEIIQTFTPKELTKFEDFVKSPFYNKNKNVIKLFEEVRKHAPDFSSAKLEKEKVWENLFPDLKYNYGIMKNLIFDLTKLADSYLTETQFRSDLLKQDQYSLEAYLEKGLSKIFNNKYSSILRKTASYPKGLNTINVNRYNNFLADVYNTKINFNNLFDHDKISIELLIKRDVAHISSLLVTMLGAYNDVIALQHDMNVSIEDNPLLTFLEAVAPAIDSIIGSIEKSSKLNSVYIKIYYCMYQSLKERTEEKYLEFKKILFDNMDIISDSDKRDLHICLITAVGNTKKSSLNLNKEIVDIFDSQISNNVILEKDNNTIPMTVFSLYIQCAFFISSDTKIRSFSDAFIKNLDPQFAESMRHYTNFMVSFINKNFDEALNSVSLVDFPYTSLKITLRQQKAMTIYELNDFELFLNEFDNLKHFIKNNDFIKEGFKNKLHQFYLFIHRLFLLRQNFDKYKFELLKKEIYDKFKDSIVWFEEKLIEIEKQNVKFDKPAYKVKS